MSLIRWINHQIRVHCKPYAVQGVPCICHPSCILVGFALSCRLICNWLYDKMQQPWRHGQNLQLWGFKLVIQVDCWLNGTSIELRVVLTSPRSGWRSPFGLTNLHQIWVYLYFLVIMFPFMQTMKKNLMHKHILVFLSCFWFSFAFSLLPDHRGLHILTLRWFEGDIVP